MISMMPLCSIHILPTTTLWTLHVTLLQVYDSFHLCRINYILPPPSSYNVNNTMKDTILLLELSGNNTFGLYFDTLAPKFQFWINRAAKNKCVIFGMESWYWWMVAYLFTHNAAKINILYLIFLNGELEWFYNDGFK